MKLLRLPARFSGAAATAALLLCAAPSYSSVKNIKTIVATLAGCLCFTQLLFAAADSKKPSVILVLADDLGAKELGCYGNTEHKTPHLDRMAAEGLRLDTFYSTPLCTPTRVCLMTGQYGFGGCRPGSASSWCWRWKSGARCGSATT